MAYIKKIKKTATVSFSKINSETPTSVARKMQKEIIAFFKKNPKGKLDFQFGGYVRLSSKFAKALFKDNLLEDYLDKIVTRQIHVFDQQTINRALE